MRITGGYRTMKSTRATRLLVESLEGRQLLAVGVVSSPLAGIPSEAWPAAIGRPVAEPAPSDTFSVTYSASEPSMPGGPTVDPLVGPQASAPYTPAQIRHAYGFDQLGYDGTGQTIAIIDAFDSPSIATDLQAFNARFGLPNSTFIKATPQGAPAYNSGWALEIALDVEWAHAIAPMATILLVEAKSNSFTDLLGAVEYAVGQGANQVSMSFGGAEFAGVSQFDSYFNHPGVTFLASSGDSGAEVLAPAVSPYVTGVGGTYMPLDSAGNRISETVWSGSGGGISAQVGLPSYQQGFVSGSFRGVPDVSYNASPSSGVYVINNGRWSTVGGTSAGAPQWAGLIALANQGRASAGLPPLGTGQTFGTNSVLYNLAGGSSYTNPNGDFLDITSGSNGTSAKVGYDTATGLGSPVANKLVPDLIGTTTGTATPSVADGGFESPVVGYGKVARPAGIAWSFSTGPAGSGSNACISGNNSPYTSGNPAAPEGQQVAVIQRLGAISQTIAGWAAGRYTIAFQAARRGNYGPGSDDIQVLVDGIAVGTILPTSTSYNSFTTAAFSVAAGSHTITFQGLNSKGGDNSTLIDAISIQARPASTSLENAGFESPVVGYGKVARPAGIAWSFSTGPAGSGSNACISGNNSPYTSGNPAAPEGQQVAVIQRLGAISQTIAGWAAGRYTIAFQAARRGNYGPGSDDIQVLVDGIAVGTILPTSTSYNSFTTAAFSVAAGSHTITLQGLNSKGGDNSTLIDAISINSA
ncbi:hypothetical protein P12x_005540 [Tundrisphaera lichenicola]|uniref:S53 family peptidase n=1 Tax=Tundrisphaera lichenicola TaxID=2029860 RepID=UPI003EBFAEEF